MSEALKRRLARARAKIDLLERTIEDRSRDLYRAKERLSRVIETIDGALLVTDAEGIVRMANESAAMLLGSARDDLLGREIRALVRLEESDAEFGWSRAVRRVEAYLRPTEGVEIPVLFSACPMVGDGGAIEGAACLATDLRERKKLEMDLRQAQKLESIGALAAGIAHEINTPIQFVGDSAHFLSEAWEDVSGVLGAYEDLLAAVESGRDPKASIEKVAQTTEEADLDFLREEVPDAVERTLEGVGRVSSIVKAMKEFSHPGGAETAPSDLNASIETTLTVARNEYKYIAELETELGDLPMVVCSIGDVNQVILNLVVNAAHAIEATGKERGRIVVRSRHEGEWVVVEVEDDGGGIPDEVRSRIFDPFFTTKEVGKGSGQGLAIARNVVVDKHGGDLRFDVREGVGTTFRVELPIGGPGG